MTRKCLPLVLLTSLCAAALADPPVTVSDLRAEGKGQVWVCGRGRADFDLDGAGTLTVRYADENQLRMTGSGARMLEGTTAKFVGYKGSVTIDGARLAAHFIGGAVAVRTRGDARVILAGSGKYWLDDAEGKDWNPYGETIVIGAPRESDEDEFAISDAEYQAQSSAAVKEITTFPAYPRWANVYPAAAAVFLTTGSFYDWWTVYPSAAEALYGWPGWDAWIVLRPRLCTFLNHHHLFMSWSRKFPDFAAYFWHPHVYHCWARRYPAAAADISLSIGYPDWSRRHPRAAASADGFRNARLEHERTTTRPGLRVDFSPPARTTPATVWMSRESDDGGRRPSGSGQRIISTPSRTPPTPPTPPRTVTERLPAPSGASDRHAIRRESDAIRETVPPALVRPEPSPGTGDVPRTIRETVLPALVRPEPSPSAVGVPRAVRDVQTPPVTSSEPPKRTGPEPRLLTTTRLPVPVARLDTNGDGQVTRTDIGAARQAFETGRNRTDNPLAAFDRNRDGKISDDEVKASPELFRMSRLPDPPARSGEKRGR